MQDGDTIAPERPEKKHPATEVAHEKSRDYAAWLATAVAAVALIQGSTAGPFWKDAGEMAASAVDMGVAHPTGFSTWAAVARLFAGIPLGTLHLRIALASAIPMALCLGLIAHLLRPDAGYKKPNDLILRGLGLPLLALSCPTIWYLGTTPEVYALAALLALSWLLAFREGLAPKQKLMNGALILGLAPGVHITALFGAISIVTAEGIENIKSWLRRPSWVLKAFPIFLLSASGLFATMIAAKRNSELNFDNPQNIERLWRHISAQGIQERFSISGARPNSAEIIELHQAFLFGELGLVLIFAGVAGAILARRRKISWSLSLIAIADMSYNILINPMGRRDLQTGVLTALCVSALAILSIQTISAYLPRLKQTASLMFLCALMISKAATFQTHQEHREGIAHDPIPLQLSRIALAPLAPNTLVFSSSDDLIGLLYAARRIEGRRPDISQVLTSFAWWPWHLKKQGLQVHGDGTPPKNDQEQIQILKKILREENPKRMMVWEPGAGILDSVVGVRLQAGLLFGPITASAPSRERWDTISELAQTLIQDNHASVHPWSKRVISESLRLNAVNAMRANKGKEGSIWSKEAVAIDPSNAAAWNNLGVSQLRDGKSDEALDSLQQAATLQKFNSRIWRNLGLSLLENREPKSARTAFKRAEDTANNPRDLKLAKELLERGLKN